MGKNFSLLQQLDKRQTTPKEISPFPKGVDYQEYAVEVAGKDVNVFIPLRECAAFEETLSGLTKYLGRDDLRRILRKHRGIRA